MKSAAVCRRQHLYGASSISDEEIFLRQIVEADLRDLTPRLVFADWLEERNDPRGELIRIQCELTEMPQDVDELTDDEFEYRDQIMQRGDELLKQFEAQWLDPIKPFINHYRFHLGLIEYVDIDVKQLAEYGDELFAFAPVRFMNIRKVAQHRSGSLEDVVDLRGMQQLTGLAFSDSRFEKEEMARLTSWLQHSCATRLILSNCGLRDQVMEPWKQLRASRLLELDLSHNALRNAGIVCLGASPGLKQLHSLDLSNNQLRIRGAESLVESTHLKGLQYLAITNNPVVQEDRAIKFLRNRFENVVC